MQGMWCSCESGPVHADQGLQGLLLTGLPRNAASLQVV
jgi:hypothetical protein